MNAISPLRDETYRPQRMSLADAIQALQKMEVHEEAECRIVTQPWTAQDGTKTSLVQVRADDPSGRHYRVPMPSAHRFSAKTTWDVRIEREISALDGARFDMDGNVTLANGLHLHALKLHPTALIFELTDQQKAILHLTIAYFKLERECYRPLDPEFSVLVLDYAALRCRPVRSLKALQRHVLQFGLNVSRQAIADALAAAGMRRPRSGKRSEQ